MRAVVTVLILAFAVIALAASVLVFVFGFDGAVVDTQEVTAEHAEGIGEPIATPTPDGSEPQADEVDTESESDTHVTVMIEEIFSGALLRDDAVYFHYMRTEFPYYHIYIRRVAVDGTEPESEPELVAVLVWEPFDARCWPAVVGFDVTDEGQFQLLVWEEPRRDEDAPSHLIYAVFDSSGELVSRTETRGVAEALDGPGSVWRVIFADTGDILLHAWIWYGPNFDDDVQSVHVIGSDGMHRRMFEIGRFGELARLRDGRIVFLEDGGIREIDLARADWGEMIAEWEAWVWELYSSQVGDPFDLYVERGAGGRAHLYGYDLASGEWTRLLDLDALDFWPRFTGLLSDGRIVMLEIGEVGNDVTYLHILHSLEG